MDVTEYWNGLNKAWVWCTGEAQAQGRRRSGKDLDRCS